MLIRDQDIDAAKTEIAILAEQKGEDSDIIKLHAPVAGSED